MKSAVIFLISLMSISSAFAITKDGEGTINIKINGIENTGGVMMIALFNEEDKFLKTPSYSQEVKISSETEIEVMFKDIPYRRYAISIFHDLNENGELDSNMIMIPKEPIGFSNDYFPKFGPPKFKYASFDMNRKDLSMTVNLRSY